MSTSTPSNVDPEVAAAIVATVEDYYGGWFEGDVERMRRALHPELVKRDIVDPPGVVDTGTFDAMLDATGRGVGTRHRPELRHVDISVNHVHGTIADVHATGEVYVDYLQLVLVDGRWQILNALWAPAGAPSEAATP